ncbi:hypothetical protein, partial [Blautia sp.]
MYPNKEQRVQIEQT